MNHLCMFKILFSFLIVFFIFAWCHGFLHFTVPFPLICLGVPPPPSSVVEEMTKFASRKISTKSIKIFMPNKFVTWILPFKRFRVRMTVSRKVGYLVLVRLEPMQSIQVYWFGLSSGMVKPHLPCKIQIFLFKCQNYTKTEMLHYPYLHNFILKKVLLV